MWNINIYVICSIAVSLTESTTAENDYEFFEHEQAAFTCKHNKTLAELSKVQWKKGTDIYATVLIESGTAKNPTYNSAVESRVNLTFTELTILSMEPYDDGEFTCIVEDINFDAVLTDTSFTLFIKVLPKNHRLLVNDKSYACSEHIVMDSAPNNITLKCSVESKPQATFTWFTSPPLSGPLLNETKCVRDNVNLPYTCTNILTVPSDKVPMSDVTVVTCRVEAVSNTTDLCATFVAEVITTTALTSTNANEDIKTTATSMTSHPAPGPIPTTTVTSVDMKTTAHPDRTDAGGSANQLGSWSVVYLVCWALVLLH